MNVAIKGVVGRRVKGERKGVRCPGDARVKDAIRVSRRAGGDAVDAGDPIPLDGVALGNDNEGGREIIAAALSHLDEMRRSASDLAKQGERKN